MKELQNVDLDEEIHWTSTMEVLKGERERERKLKVNLFFAR